MGVHIPVVEVSSESYALSLRNMRRVKVARFVEVLRFLQKD
jgi:hypothetical protein